MDGWMDGVDWGLGGISNVRALDEMISPFGLLFHFVPVPAPVGFSFLCV